MNEARIVQDKRYEGSEYFYLADKETGESILAGLRTRHSAEKALEMHNRIITLEAENAELAMKLGQAAHAAVVIQNEAERIQAIYKSSFE